MGLARELGLILHHLFRSPPKPPDAQAVHRRQTTREKRVNDRVTVRRTTIEEIEVRTDQEPDTRDRKG